MTASARLIVRRAKWMSLDAVSQDPVDAANI